MDFIESVISANIEIDKLIQNGDATFKNRVSKGAGGDVSRVVDIEAEKIFIKYLSPFGKILSEEIGEIGEGEDIIVIDPIDGSENFVSDLPYFGTSVARKKRGEVSDAIVVNLANKDVYIKNRHDFKKGKLYNKEVSDIIINNYATIGIYERSYASKNLVTKINESGFKYRSPGALALSLAYAHNFSFVLFEGAIREFDVCAGVYMCEDLNMFEKEGFLLVSKDRDTFDTIVRLIEEM